MEKTAAEYSVDEMKFTSVTNTVLNYDVFRERGAILSLGYRIKPGVSIGIRWRRKHQLARKGTITRPLEITAVHGEDVNRNDATKLLPAIMNNLDIGDAIDNFKKGEGSTEDVITDQSGTGNVLDLGMQSMLPLPGNMVFGFILSNVTQRRIVNSEPSTMRIGIGASPNEWFSAALDLQKQLTGGSMNLNLGWEVHLKWNRWFSAGIMLRNGFAREASVDKLAFGLGLVLGSSHWEYSVVKPLDGSPLRESVQMISSSTRF